MKKRIPLKDAFAGGTRRAADALARTFRSAAGTLRRIAGRIAETAKSLSGRFLEAIRSIRERGRSAQDDASAMDGQTIVFEKPETAHAPGRKGASVFSPVEVRHDRFGLEILAMTARLLLLTILVVGVAFAGIATGVVKAYIDMAPELDIKAISVQSQGSKIYDANGDLITTYSGTEDRIYAQLSEIPQKLLDAFIATEDIRFYYHNGVDIKRLFSAVVGNLTNTSTAGGSTITQQLIKNRILSPERTLKRKAQEAYLALQLEASFTKEQILEAYLNSINLGGTNYGVAAAAQDYFGKSLNQLNLRECATIAGLAQAPNSYNPRKNYYVRKTPERTDNRTDIVLKRMYNGGFITRSEYEQALKTKLSVVEKGSSSGIYDMPHFVEYAINDVITHFLKERGLTDTQQNRAAIENEIRTSGYKIYTTVDPDIQHTVETSLANWKRYPRFENPNQKTVTYTNADGSTYTVEQPQAAAVVMDQHTGQIKALVGSRTVPTMMKTKNLATDGEMPVGSSIKPLTVYGPALDMGLTPSTIVQNTNEKIPGWDSPSGRPSNYGEGSFTGPTTMRSGLVHSYNIVAARLLMENVGLNDAYNYLISLGVDPDHINKTGAGLALGTSGITPLEMAGGFSAIANAGEYNEPISFTQVVDEKGNVILDATRTQEHRQVYKRSTSYQLISMMKEAVSSGTGTRAKISGQEVAGKTGTNDAFRGVFFAGITGYYTATVWIGHANYYPSFVYGTTGGSYYGAAPLWQDFMSKILKGRPNKAILDGKPEDYGLVKCTVCKTSGLLAGKYCTETYTEYFSEDTKPTQTCTQHTATDFNDEVNAYIQTVYDRMSRYNVPENVRAAIQAKSNAFIEALDAARDYKEIQSLFNAYKAEMEALLKPYASSPTQTPPPTTASPSPTISPTTAPVTPSPRPS
jgi:penicillin-binding protein 1A